MFVAAMILYVITSARSLLIIFWKIGLTGGSMILPASVLEDLSGPRTQSAQWPLASGHLRLEIQDVRYQCTLASDIARDFAAFARLCID